jgi:hypothetical protein
VLGALRDRLLIQAKQLLGALMDWLGWRNIKVVHLLSMNQATLSTSLIPTFVSTTLQMELGMHVKIPGREGHTV